MSNNSKSIDFFSKFFFEFFKNFQKSKFFKNQNSCRKYNIFCQKSKCLSKIEMFVKNSNFPPKIQKKVSKIHFFVNNRIFCQQSKFSVRNTWRNPNGACRYCHIVQRCQNVKWYFLPILSKYKFRIPHRFFGTGFNSNNRDNSRHATSPAPHRRRFFRRDQTSVQSYHFKG